MPNNNNRSDGMPSISAQPPECFTRERDSEQRAENWCSDLGAFIRPEVKPSIKSLFTQWVNDNAPKTWQSKRGVAKHGGDRKSSTTNST